MATPLFTDKELEQEVTRLAKLLWPEAEGGGAVVADGQERDGVFFTDEYVHVVECTTSRREDKAEEDGEKLLKLCRKLETKHQTKHVKGWFITLADPTPEQRTAINKLRGKLVAVSYEEFRSKLVDARLYLTLRENYQFGSMRDPESGSTQVSFRYVEQDILTDSGQRCSVQSISDGVSAGSGFVLTGDYGAGKSTTLREIFLCLAKKYRANQTLRFPLTINLRDHHGQNNPVEAIERHARNVGFPNPSHLVRAWRAGYAHILLDGFDEIATAGWAGRTKRLRDLRFRSMELIRAFIRDGRGVGIVLAGRAHFFDSDKEKTTALGVVEGFTNLSLCEFSNHQVTDYLRSRGLFQQIPEWIPARPLLLGYLSSRGLLGQILSGAAVSNAAQGWNSLLERISQREAEIEAGLDPETVRLLIENLASAARTSADGLGPLSPDQILGAFVAVCGHQPDDRGAVLLQRLPGLGGSSAEDGSRVFIDADFASAAAAGTVFHFIDDPYGSTANSKNWISALKPLGADVVAIRCADASLPPAKLATAAAHASTNEQNTLAADVFLSLLSLGHPCTSERLLPIKDVLIPQLSFGPTHEDMHNVEFQACIISKLEIDADATASHLPVFRRCDIASMEGRLSERDLPQGHFVDCTIDQYEDSAQTTSGLLALSLPTGVKVLLTVLKKLYAQSGRGRLETAFFRGLDHREKAFVSPILAVLKREGFVTEASVTRQRAWIPTRGSEMRRRALRILSAPNEAGVSGPFMWTGQS